MAGVLQGERARFQLFGDTGKDKFTKVAVTRRSTFAMVFPPSLTYAAVSAVSLEVNTASRMESSGLSDKIHISQGTADLLIRDGKEHWVMPRKELVDAKGIGQMQTYWLEIKGGTGSVANSVDKELASSKKGSSHEELSGLTKGLTKHKQRLVDWNVGMFEGLLKVVVAHHRSLNGGKKKPRIHPVNFSAIRKRGNSKRSLVQYEVSDRIPLPLSNSILNETNVGNQYLSPNVVMQLHEYISAIALLYPENAFRLLYVLVTPRYAFTYITG